MNTHVVQSQTSVIESEAGTASLRIPDASSAAEAALDVALHYCCDKLGAGSIDTVKESLRQGDSTSRGYFNFSLAHAVAEYLGAFDRDVTSVYLFDYDATPEDLCFGEAVCNLLLHLIVRVNRPTAAFQSLVEALDGALIRRYAGVMGMDEPAHLLDVQVVEEEDVRLRNGYGALLSSVHHRPIQVWGRSVVAA